MAGTLQDWDIISGVGITALAVAAARAVETNRAEGLVRDPFAGAFVQASGVRVPMPTRLDDVTESAPESDRLWDIMAAGMGVRSKFFDDYFVTCWAAGVRQAVLLAAGLDTRAFRLDWPAGCTVFEIDKPQVLKFKDVVLYEQRARPQCARQVVAIDLRDDWEDVLLGAGFDLSQPTAWLAEGLLPYLPAQAERQLLETIDRLSAPGSWLAFEHFEINEPLLDRLRNAAGTLGFDVSTLFATELRDDPARYLAGHRWEVADVSGAELIERYQPRLSTLLPSAHAHHYQTARLLRT